MSTNDRSIGSMVRQDDTRAHGRNRARREPRRHGTRTAILRRELWEA